MKINAEIYVGPRNCGKSEIAEKSINNINNKIYFGTIANKIINCELIERHKIRRGDKWILIETKCDLAKDIAEIEKIIKRRNIKACLIDGMTLWVSNICKNRYEILNYTDLLIDELIGLVYKYKSVRWIFIDVTPNQFMDEEKIYEYVCKKIKNKLKNEIFNLKIIEYR